jgi:hypothetical protein
MDIDYIESLETEYPWQETPLKIIWFAISLADKGGDFSSQISFLLLDIGVETLFKTYFSLDNEITNSKLPYHQSIKLATGKSFHALVQGMKEATDDYLDPKILDKVMSFHKVRNKLYHPAWQGRENTL